ncbi:DNA alkylation repair protein [Kitasatospora sp. NPDC059827]|uniref:DNA alkylation repair protein n=1 Tax=Kitasatospora sp. NPDC059827 TaxID=3346964 RepID=UPI00364AA417
MNTEAVAGELLASLAARGDADFAVGMQRYFPHEIRALGVGNAAVVALAGDFFREHGDVPAAARLRLAEEVLARADHHEEVLLGFALLHKVARTGLGDDFLDRCEGWLERYVSNWAQCDDLCLKLLYPYFLGHLDRLPRTTRWVGSESPWARRAANVAVVKFVRRKVGKVTYELPVAHVLDNCTRLMHDKDPYVQKGSGWLLKVTAQVHPAEVEAYLRQWRPVMKRDTFRYALEGLDKETRGALMALGGKAEA